VLVNRGFKIIIIIVIVLVNRRFRTMLVNRRFRIILVMVLVNRNIIIRFLRKLIIIYKKIEL